MDDERTEVIGEPVRVAVSALHHATVARGAALALAREVGLPRIAGAEVATCVSELATNLALHSSRGGFINLVRVRRDGRIGVRVIVEDDGPGIEDVERAMEDGFSTAGGLGGGLPGARRMMDEFQIISRVGAGTRIVATKWPPDLRQRRR